MKVKKYGNVVVEFIMQINPTELKKGMIKDFNKQNSLRSTSTLFNRMSIVVQTSNSHDPLNDLILKIKDKKDKKNIKVAIQEY